MDIKYLDPKAKKYFFVSFGCLALLILLFVLIFVALFLSELIGVGVLVLLTVVDVALAIFTGIIYPSLKYKCYSYYYQEDKIVVKYGVIFKHCLTIPSIQIQDLHIVQGPILSAFKLSCIIISTAGSNFSLGPIGHDLSLKLVDEFENNLLTRAKLSLKD